jgi:hypothetical protein
MKKTAITFLIILAVFSLSLSLYAAKPIKVEVLYMNHGPLQSTLRQIKNIFSRYGDKLTVSWFDFETREGEQFMAKKGIRQHIPLVIWIEDSPVFKMGGKEIKFVGFPTGSGPAFFQGKWTLDDLKAALDQSTRISVKN